LLTDGSGILAKCRSLSRSILNHFASLLFSNSQRLLKGRTQVREAGLRRRPLEGRTRFSKLTRKSFSRLFSRQAFRFKTLCSRGYVVKGARDILCVVSAASSSTKRTKFIHDVPLEK
jgi:hypothetical protein